MSVAHLNTTAAETPERSVAFDCRARSGMLNAGAGAAFNETPDALAARCLR